MSGEIRNVIVIGSGPAGYTAALYTARADLKPLVFEGSVTAGGALMNTTEVENFPGFPEGIVGPDLMDSMRAQAARFGAELVADDVVAVDLTGSVKTVTDSSGTVHRARTVIVTTGSQHRKLHLDREDDLSGRGVSYCATCDGFFFRERDIVVVGGGDTAMEEATFLTRFARSVTVVHRRSTLRASQAMQNRAFADDKISFAFDSEIAEIKEEGGALSGLVLRDVFSGETRELAATGLFVAIGHDPRTELFAGQLDLDDEGYLKVASPSTRTNIPGVFGAGDVVDHTYRQAITAAGSGCAAALDAERHLAALTDTAQDAEPDRTPAAA
ncbi:thioredoxin-disulfide reductase [Streptomyces mutabilis]|uniref:Thioredoxin reductase n=1 Tax=Streptomyces griseiscabiei TaxID=2993540 RepID=A0ABU4LF12_9ACTN|nr:MULTISPECIES: thioredoxin-disulfide reductase [Streptomyces]AHE39950.1 Putative thioredoxin reductase (NADPH) [Streptomyces sp. F8]MBZ3908375.1 thioredoxin-disulfide reductase [Streptomyces griseiscabiei]MDX2913890.1 thioredoxin-disulfide reductase [Streptomyces griseiscabiei]